MTDTREPIAFDRARVDLLLARLEEMAGGVIGAKLPLSPARDELDAISFGVNTLADELRWTSRRTAEIERRTAEELLWAKERAERANETKSIFLRTASHEIRTPIAAILGIADVLALGGVTDDDRVDLVDRLRSNSRALLSLVGNVLDLSRLDADKMDLTLEPVSLPDLAREVTRSLEPDAQKKRLSLRVDADPRMPIVIETDRMRMRQILVNVLANAIKFTSRGGVIISMREEAAAAKRRVVIDVIDSGIGVHPDQREHLFEPFAQANSSIARMHGGSGLGLALSSRLAERLGGTLTLASSELGRGSTFRLTLYVAPARSTSSNGGCEASGSPAGNQTRGMLDGMRVLLTDDNPDLQVAIGRVLKVHGAAVEYASDGGEAVRAARSGRFDVVLMDMLMPNTNGLEAARMLRHDGYEVPIIAISADASPESRAAAADAGCDAYLCKPFEPSDLTSAIRFARRTPADALAAIGAK